MNITQLPSSIEPERIEWSGDEWSIWIELNPLSKAMKLRGEALEWVPDGHGDGDWEGKPLTRNEILNIAALNGLVVPTYSAGVKKLTDIFKRKETI